MDNLQLIILDNAIEHLEHPLTQKIFSRLMGLKASSYRDLYGDVCPIGKNEFVGRHQIICEVVDDDYYPVLSCRVDSKEICTKYHIDFPVRSMLINGKSEGAEVALAKVNEEIKKSNDQCVYTGSWCVAKKYKKTSKATTLNSIVGGIGLHDYLCSDNTAMFTAGSILAGTVKYFDFLGFKRVPDGEFFDPAVNNRSIFFYVERKFSKAGMRLAKRYQPLYEQRITLDKSYYTA